jgi:hypothetical protein
MLEAFRGELLVLLQISLDRREARVMLAQAQLRLTRDRLNDAPTTINSGSRFSKKSNRCRTKFAASDVLATAMADVTLYSIRCGRNPETD